MLTYLVLKYLTSNCTPTHWILVFGVAPTALQGASVAYYNLKALSKTKLVTIVLFNLYYAHQYICVGLLYCFSW